MWSAHRTGSKKVWKQCANGVNIVSESLGLIGIDATCLHILTKVCQFIRRTPLEPQHIFEFSILSLVVLWCLVQLCQCSICSITRRSSGWSALHPSLCSVTKSMFLQTIKLSDNRQSLAQVCGFHCGTNFEQNESEKRYQVGCLHEMLSICTLFDKLSKIM